MELDSMEKQTHMLLNRHFKVLHNHKCLVDLTKVFWRDKVSTPEVINQHLVWMYNAIFKVVHCTDILK